MYGIRGQWSMYGISQVSGQCMGSVRSVVNVWNQSGQWSMYGISQVSGQCMGSEVSGQCMGSVRPVVNVSIDVMICFCLTAIQLPLLNSTMSLLIHYVILWFILYIPMWLLCTISGKNKVICICICNNICSVRTLWYMRKCELKFHIFSLRLFCFWDIYFLLSLLSLQQLFAALNFYLNMMPLIFFSFKSLYLSWIVLNLKCVYFTDFKLFLTKTI